eukprot:4094641-Pyramimonas_sp.AAC.1
MVVGTHIHDSTPSMPGICRLFDRVVPIGDPRQESIKKGQPGRGLRQEQRDRVVAGHPLTSERIGRTRIGYDHTIDSAEPKTAERTS